MAGKRKWAKPTKVIMQLIARRMAIGKSQRRLNVEPKREPIPRDLSRCKLIPR